MQKILKMGNKKLEKKLDISNMIRESRAKSTLFRLLLSKEERSLLRMQRRGIVL